MRVTYVCMYASMYVVYVLRACAGACEHARGTWFILDAYKIACEHAHISVDKYCVGSLHCILLLAGSFSFLNLITKCDHVEEKNKYLLPCSVFFL